MDSPLLFQYLLQILLDLFQRSGKLREMLFKKHHAVRHSFAFLIFIRFGDGQIVAALDGFFHIKEIIFTSRLDHLRKDFFRHILRRHILLLHFVFARAPSAGG